MNNPKCYYDSETSSEVKLTNKNYAEKKKYLKATLGGFLSIDTFMPNVDIVCKLCITIFINKSQLTKRIWTRCWKISARIRAESWTPKLYKHSLRLLVCKKATKKQTDFIIKVCIITDFESSIIGFLAFGHQLNLFMRVNNVIYKSISEVMIVFVHFLSCLWILVIV